MKKAYRAPSLEIEEYELNVNIASNCSTVVSNGPREACSDYEDPFGTTTMSLRDEPVYNVEFYEDNCDCYYDAGGDGYWTS